MFTVTTTMVRILGMYTLYRKDTIDCLSLIRQIAFYAVNVANGHGKKLNYVSIVGIVLQIIWQSRTSNFKKSNSKRLDFG